ncbi:hypothetical protein KUL25_02800 [Rhodobacteraceae bacterium N5(2021)]|uniref:Tetratricopeptide repeat protein n=1 Tax=Gymnodinialimonas phycosphaerae TaxID=2841589 RepID=A0A975TXD1_9RHOB|nr:hypothetical protein [Gymnodinialimonas phycosphaerae]MBY4891690.1 hypothetical protein [Gymnodinialimonas phycosphaerae]
MGEDLFDISLRHARATGDWSRVISHYVAVAKGDSAAFYLTHAYVHALEGADPRASDLRARLVALGAEAPEALA